MNRKSPSTNEQVSSSDESSTIKAYQPLSMQKIVDQEESSNDIRMSDSHLGIFPRPLPMVSVHKMIESKSHPSPPINFDRSSSPFDFERMATESKDGVLPAGKDLDTFVLQSSTNKSYSLFELKPIAPSSTSLKKKRKTIFRVETDVISFEKLNKLMERTASSRCLLLQHTKTNRRASLPLIGSLSSSGLMGSLSNSAFRSIVSANRIASLDIHERNNSTFDENSGFRHGTRPKKRRSSCTAIDSYRITQKPRGQQEYIVKAAIHSLPSCGSLDNSPEHRGKDGKRIGNGSHLNNERAKNAVFPGINDVKSPLQTQQQLEPKKQRVIRFERTDYVHSVSPGEKGKEDQSFRVPSKSAIQQQKTLQDELDRWSTNSSTRTQGLEPPSKPIRRASMTIFGSLLPAPSLPLDPNMLVSDESPHTTIMPNRKLIVDKAWDEIKSAEKLYSDEYLRRSWYAEEQGDGWHSHSYSHSHSHSHSSSHSHSHEHTHTYSHSHPGHSQLHSHWHPHSDWHA